MGRLNLTGASIVWYIEMPDSWSEEKKAAMKGTHHLGKPDLSNLLKAIEDALYSPRYTGRDDKVIWKMGSMAKLWWDKGQIWVQPDPEQPAYE